MLIRIGTIVRAHGIGGELKVRPDTDDPDRFGLLSTVYVGSGADSAVPVSVESARLQTSRHGITVLLALEGVDTREKADAHRGNNVYAREADLPDLKEGEWYLDELLGMSVFTTDASIGVVSDVLELPAHPVLVVDRPGGRETMIPAVAPFVVDVDVESRVIRVELPEGLIEDQE